jgi:hypothetical protein
MRAYDRATSTWSNWYTQSFYAAWNNTKSNNPNFPHPDTTRPIDAYSLDNFGGELRERVYQDTRYWYRTSKDNGKNWTVWYTNTFASSWDGSKGSKPNTGKKVDETNFYPIKNGDYTFLEEVVQGSTIYYRYENTAQSLFGDWAIKTTKEKPSAELN